MTEPTAPAEPGRGPRLSRKTVLWVLAAAVVLWATALVLWQQVGIDRALLVSQAGLRSSPVAAGLARLATRYGMSLAVLVYLVLHLVRCRDAGGRAAGAISLTVILLFALAGIGGDLLKEIIDRPRPAEALAGVLAGVQPSGSPSLPSGHGTKSIALALPYLFLASSRGSRQLGVKALLALVATSVCYSRFLLGKHYASDLLAAAGTALLFLPVAVALSRRILRRMDDRRVERAARVWALVLFGLMIGLPFL